MLYFCIFDTQIHINSIIICVYNSINRNNGMQLVKVLSDIPFRLKAYCNFCSAGCFRLKSLLQGAFSRILGDVNTNLVYWRTYTVYSQKYISMFMPSFLFCTWSFNIFNLITYSPTVRHPPPSASLRQLQRALGGSRRLKNAFKKNPKIQKMTGFEMHFVTQCRRAREKLFWFVALT